jgi:hypothetical protein
VSGKYLRGPEGRAQEARGVVPQQGRQLQEQRHYLYLERLLEVLEVHEDDELPKHEEHPQETQRQHRRLDLLDDHELDEGPGHQDADDVVDWPGVGEHEDVEDPQQEGGEGGCSEDEGGLAEADGEDVDEVDRGAEEGEEHNQPEGDLEGVVDVGVDVDRDEEDGCIGQREDVVEGPGREPAVLDVVRDDHQQGEGQHLRQQDRILRQVYYVHVLALRALPRPVHQVHHSLLT